MFVHPTVQHNVNEIVRKRSLERGSLRLRSSVRFTKGRQTLDQETMTSPESSKKEKLIRCYRLELLFLILLPVRVGSNVN